MKALDIIYIHGLKCECRIGVWEWEKQLSQTLVLDIDLATEISKSAESDDLKDTLNYQRISERVINFAQQSNFDLIETLAEKLAVIILEEFDVSGVRIKLDKGQAVKQAKNVGVIIERGSFK